MRDEPSNASKQTNLIDMQAPSGMIDAADVGNEVYHVRILNKRHAMHAEAMTFNNDVLTFG